MTTGEYIGMNAGQASFMFSSQRGENSLVPEVLTARYGAIKRTLDIQTWRTAEQIKKITEQLAREETLLADLNSKVYDGVSTAPNHILSAEQLPAKSPLLVIECVDPGDVSQGLIDMKIRETGIKNRNGIVVLVVRDNLHVDIVSENPTFDLITRLQYATHLRGVDVIMPAFTSSDLLNRVDSETKGPILTTLETEASCYIDTREQLLEGRISSACKFVEVSAKSQ